MRSHVSYRTLTAVCLVCLWATVCIGLNGFTPTVIAQEPTTDSSALPTPTTAPTWTPTVVGTPDPHATATSPSGTPATPTGRAVDFRVDDRNISAGECVTFSWLVRGDIDKVEFDQHDDNKNAVLVPEEKYDAEECPGSTTEYNLIVSWLDGTRTTQTIKVKVEDADDDGGDGEADQTVTPVGTAGFLPVTPLPISGMSGESGGGGQGATPQSVAYQSAPDGVVVTPVGALGSVTLLPETGYGPPPAAGASRILGGVGTRRAAPLPRVQKFRMPSPVWPPSAAESGMFLGGMVVIGLILSIKHTH
jgi:hypothetical protein